MNKLYKIILISFLFITILLVCINKFEKETFVNIVKPTNKIVIFYHICELGNWDQIVNEQLDLIKSSGLYNIIESINIGFLGEKKHILPYLNNKIKLVYHSDNKTEYEMPTVNKIMEFCEKEEHEYYILYIHSKGVTKLTTNKKEKYNGQHYWRKYMNYWNITKHKICIEQLNKGFYTVGINCWGDHYSGNFWWANSIYIKNNLKYLKHKDDKGMQAEFWLLTQKKPNKHICLVDKVYDSRRHDLSGLYSFKIKPTDYGKLNIKIF